MRNGKKYCRASTLSLLSRRKTWQLTFLMPLLSPVQQKIIDMAMNGVGCRMPPRLMGVGLNTILRHLKTQAAVSNLPIQPGSDVIVCAEMDGAMGLRRCKITSAPRLFYAYDRIRRAVVAHVFGERTMATLERLLSPAVSFDVVVWMTDGWPM